MNEVPRHWGQEHKHSAACSHRGQAEVQAEVLGCLGQALSDTLAVCLIICKAGGAGECKCDQFLSESPVLLAPTPRQPARHILLGDRALLQELVAVSQLREGARRDPQRDLSSWLLQMCIAPLRKLWGAMSSAGEWD